MVVERLLKLILLKLINLPSSSEYETTFVPSRRAPDGNVAARKLTNGEIGVIRPDPFTHESLQSRPDAQLRTKAVKRRHAALAGVNRSEP
ncbi:hypothetical protein [Lysobacter niastensis]